MPVTRAQRNTIDQILAVIETGELPSDSAYASIGDRKDGAGLTGGKHQATDRAGSLDAIVRTYASDPLALDPHTRDQLAAYLPWLERNGSVGDGKGNLSPQDAQDRDAFVAYFQRAADDPAMRAAQDAVFETVYWQTAVEQVQAMGLTTALAHLIIYDTSIQSGGDGVTTSRTTEQAVWEIRRLFPESPPANGGDEFAWMRAYLDARKAWLTNSSHSAVRQSAYRIDTLRRYYDAANWALDLHLDVVLPHKTVRIT